MAAATDEQARLALSYRAVASSMYALLKAVEEAKGFNDFLAVDWNTVTFTSTAYTGADVSNLIGTADFFRKLLRNESMAGAQGDHLTNVLKMAHPLLS